MRARGRDRANGRTNYQGRGSEPRTTRETVDSDGIHKLELARGPVDLVRAKKELVEWCGIAYPEVQSIFVTGEFDEIPPIDVDEEALADDPHQLYRIAHGEMLKNRLRDVRTQKKAWIPVFTKLESLMDDLLKALVQREEEYEVFYADRNPLGLWQCMQLACMVGIETNPVARRAKMREDFHAFSQTSGQSLSDFYERLLALKERMLLMGVAFPEEDWVHKFVTSLRSDRYGDYQALFLDTGVAIHGERPQTLAAAFTIVQTWDRNHAISKTTRHSEDINTDWAAFVSWRGESGRGYAQRGRGYERGRGRGRGGDGRGRGSLNSSTKEEKNAAEDNKDTKKTKSYKKDLSGIQCHACEGWGHYRSDCPSVLKKATVAICCTSKAVKSDEAVVVYDGAANISMFYSDELVEDIWNVDTVKVKGIDKRSVIVLRQQGIFLDTKVWVCPDASTNIICARDARENHHVFELEGWGVRLVNKVTKSCHDFVLEDDLLVYRPKNPVRMARDVFRLKYADEQKRKWIELCDEDTSSSYGAVACTTSAAVPAAEAKKKTFAEVVTGNTICTVVSTPTVSGNKMKFSAREVKDADRAVELHRKSGYQAVGNLKDMLTNGAILNCPVTTTDFKIAGEIYGKRSIASVKGKMHAAKPPITQTEWGSVNQRRDAKLHVDIMFVDDVATLCAVMDPIDMSLVKHLHDRRAVTIKKALDSMIATCETRNFHITEIEFDPEKALMNAVKNIPNVRHTECTVGGHVVKAERLIEQLKEGVRSVMAGLPWKVRKRLLKELIIYANSRRNAVFTSTLNGKVTPRELFTGRKINFETDYALGFGDYVQAYDPNVKKNTMAPRTSGCIALYPRGNLAGSWNFFNLETERVVSRDRWVAYDMPDVVISLMNRKAAEDLAGAVPNAGERNEMAEVVVPDMMEEPADAFPVVPVAEPLIEVPNIGEGEEEEVQNVEMRDEPIEEANDPPELPDRVEENKTVGSGGDNRTNGMITRSMSHRAANIFCGYIDRQALEKVYACNKITLQKALRKYKDKAMESCIKELKQLDDAGTWVPVDYSTLSAHQKKKIIGTFMFLNEKYLPSGDFDKLKARLVAMGNQQNAADLKMSISAPTVSTTHVFAMSALFAAEGRDITTADIGGAFTEAFIPDDIEIHTVLDKTNARLLCEIRPEYETCLRPDGSLVVELKRALYGCLMSARLWYDRLAGVLVSAGYVVNPCDICVFNKIIGTKRSTVLFHVDDLKIGSDDATDTDKLLAVLQQEFKEIKIVRGKIHSYLGMLFDYSEKNVVKISMKGFIDNVLEGRDSSQKAETPAAAYLFDIREDAVKLIGDQKKVFHSMVQRLLYLAKRVRMDILLAIAFLSTRVRDPDEDDLKKLDRVLKYLNGSRELYLTLGIKNGAIDIFGSIDASYGTHRDGKSHSGLTLSMGRGTVMAMSKKQSIVTKSSTEAEIVGVSDMLSPVIGLREFMLHQGYIDLGPALIGQDNVNGIAMMEKGKSDNFRSKHINVRYFFMKDRVASKEVKFIYVPTLETLADFMTKPLQGALFKKLRDLLLGRDP